MTKPKKSVIEVQGTDISVLSKSDVDFISLTDIARYRNSQEPFSIINNWMRSRSTIEFLGLWEKLSNPEFKPLEFERFRNEAGSNYTFDTACTRNSGFMGMTHTSGAQR